MRGACQQREKPRHERAVVADMRRVLTQELRCQVHHIFQASRGLQSCSGSNHRCNDEHHVNGDAAWSHAKDENQDKHTHHAVDTQSDATYSGADEYQRENDYQLYENYSCQHRLS